MKKGSRIKKNVRSKDALVSLVLKWHIFRMSCERNGKTRLL